MTAPPTRTRSDGLSSSSTTRRPLTSCQTERKVQFGVELRILSQAGSTSSNLDQSVADEEQLKCSVELIESYLGQSDDGSVKLLLNLFEDHPESAGLDASNREASDEDLGPIDSLGDGALENCIPPPYRSPAVSDHKRLMTADWPNNSTGLHKTLIHSQRAPLKSLKPWHRFTSLSNTPDPTYDLKLLSASSSPDSQRRGFWLIPVWKSSVTRSDYYARFGYLVSLPRWSDPSLTQPANSPSNTPEIQNSRISTPIVWNPIRLSLFWNVICIICEKRKLGDVSAIAVAHSHTKDILPYTQPTPADRNPVSIEPEDVCGDHIRIWSSLQTSLIIRRVISDITIKSAIQARGPNKKSSVPFLDFDLSREDMENQAGDYEHKWLKNCAFMWLDETGTPRGYG